jgi:hypothetical protein
MQNHIVKMGYQKSDMQNDLNSIDYELPIKNGQFNDTLAYKMYVDLLESFAISDSSVIGQIEDQFHNLKKDKDRGKEEKKRLKEIYLKWDYLYSILESDLSDLSHQINLIFKNETLSEEDETNISLKLKELQKIIKVLSIYKKTLMRL